MKNFLKNTLFLLFLTLVIINRPKVTYAILEGIKLWKNSVFPSIFPLMILSDFALSTSIINVISNTIGKPFSKIFKLSKQSSYVFLLSALSGSPTNAKYIKDLLSHQYIEKKEAEKLLAMTYLYNPILILNITSFLPVKIGVYLIITNILINIIIGIINRNNKINYTPTIKLEPQKFSLVESINKALNVSLLILGSIITFIALISLIPLKHPLISGIFEITNGITSLKSYDFSLKYNLIFISIMLSFGGLSIITQIKSIFINDKLNYSLFYKSRIIHLILFILISLIYLKYFL